MEEKRASKRSSISPPPTKRRKTRGAATRLGQAANSDLEQLTIYSWNINGIGPFIQRSITSFFKPPEGSGQAPGSNSSSLRDVLKRLEWPTMLFLQEVKIREDDVSTKAAVERSVLPDEGVDEPSYKAFFCLPSDKHNARGFGRQVYGVCSLIRTDFFTNFVSNVRGVGWDAEGRFLVCETKANDSTRPLAIFNVYAVSML